MRTVGSAEAMYHATAGNNNFGTAAQLYNAHFIDSTVAAAHNVNVGGDPATNTPKAGFRFRIQRTLIDPTSGVPSTYVISGRPATTAGATQSGVRRYCMTETGVIKSNAAGLDGVPDFHFGGQPAALGLGLRRKSDHFAFFNVTGHRDSGAAAVRSQMLGTSAPSFHFQNTFPFQVFCGPGEEYWAAQLFFITRDLTRLGLAQDESILTVKFYDNLIILSANIFEAAIGSVACSKRPDQSGLVILPIKDVNELRDRRPAGFDL